MLVYMSMLSSYPKLYCLCFPNGVVMIRVRAVAPAKVLGPPPAVDVNVEKSSTESRKKKRSLSVSVLLSKPILALQFNCLEMKVEAPTIVSNHSQNTLRQ